MSDLIIVVDSSEIREGKADELKAALDELARFVEANEVEPLAYNVYFDEDETTMTVLQIHPDSASLELHLQIAGPQFRPLADLVRLSRVDFYGDPSDAALELMQQKAGLLGDARVVVNELQAGFVRLRSAK